MWDLSGQPAYGITHMGPMRNLVALPIRVAHMCPIEACLLGASSKYPTLSYVAGS